MLGAMLLVEAVEDPLHRLGGSGSGVHVAQTLADVFGEDSSGFVMAELIADAQGPSKHNQSSGMQGAEELITTSEGPPETRCHGLEIPGGKAKLEREEAGPEQRQAQPPRSRMLERRPHVALGLRPAPTAEREQTQMGVSEVEIVVGASGLAGEFFVLREALSGEALERCDGGRKPVLVWPHAHAAPR